MKSNTVKTGVFILGLTLFMSTQSFGQSEERREKKEPPTAEKLIKQLDKDEDGQLSLEEVKGPIKKDFSKIDANEDGFLSKEELEKAPKPKKEGRRE